MTVALTQHGLDDYHYRALPVDDYHYRALLVPLGERAVQEQPPAASFRRRKAREFARGLSNSQHRHADQIIIIIMLVY